MKLNEIKHLLSPDAPMGVSADPFDTDVSNVDTSFPILSDKKMIQVEIKNADIQVTKKTAELPEDEQQKMLVFDLVTTKEELSVKKVKVHPGFTLCTHRIMITPQAADAEAGVKERTVDQIKTNLAEVMQAVFPQKAKGVKFSDVLGDPTVLNGKRLTVKPRIEEAKGDFPEKNSIGRGGFIPLT